MINLGDGPFRPKECRDIILAELRHAGVTNIIVEEKEVPVLDAGCPAAQMPPGIIIPSLEKSFHTETHFKVSAKLGGWKLARSWYYWTVGCEKLEDEIGPKDATVLFDQHGKKMRVNGNCGCPSPEGTALNYHCRVGISFISDGVDLTLDKKHVAHVPKGGDWSEEFKKIDKENPGKRHGVNGYDIDTQEAFIAFCEYLLFRGAERDKAEEAYWDERKRTDNWDLKFEPQLDDFIPEKAAGPQTPEQVHP